MLIFSTNPPPWTLRPYINRSCKQSFKMPHTWLKSLHHFINTCSAHPDLMGSGRMEPQLKPLIVPRPPAHHCGKWRSMRGKMISSFFFPGPCSLLLTTENFMLPRRNVRLWSEKQYRKCAQHLRPCVMDGNCAEKWSHVVKNGF